MSRIPEVVQKQLDRLPSGSWEIRRGGKHLKIFVRGKFVGILPSNGRKDSHGGRGGMNIASQLKRHIP